MACHYYISFICDSAHFLKEANFASISSQTSCRLPGSSGNSNESTQFVNRFFTGAFSASFRAFSISACFFFSASSRAFCSSFNFSMTSEEHTSELHSHGHLVCRLLLEKKHLHNKNSTS